MKRRSFLALPLASGPLLASFRTARPGYRYQFPRDHFNHPDFETEWWYYTGNVDSKEDRRFGFELTFFRRAADRNQTKPSLWQVDDVWLAHLALSDIGGKRYFHSERLNRSGPGLAGASAEQGLVWNGNWEVRWDAGIQHLQAVAEEFTLNLTMTAVKPPVIHGQNGVSQKAAGAGRASHYISLPRLTVDGTLALEGESHSLRGTAWMDHEFFTHQLEGNQIGWDWFSIQLNDNTELMLFRLRRKDGSVDPYSAGTFIDAQGKARHLTAGDFTLTPGAKWQTYPIAWTIEVQPLNLILQATTPLESQELVGKSKLSPSYWEGAMDFKGTRDGAPAIGRGYLEMTGYRSAVSL
jgi:predicted secreted hydrolase